MNRWFVAIILAGAFVTGGTSLATANAQPAPTTSPMASASPTPMSTMHP
jgi:hypothetical protein